MNNRYELKSINDGDKILKMKEESIKTEYASNNISEFTVKYSKLLWLSHIVEWAQSQSVQCSTDESTLSQAYALSVSCRLNKYIIF